MLEDEKKGEENITGRGVRNRLWLSFFGNFKMRFLIFSKNELHVARAPFVVFEILFRYLSSVPLLHLVLLGCLLIFWYSHIYRVAFFFDREDELARSTLTANQICLLFELLM
jgi:hypothetical protein